MFGSSTKVFDCIDLHCGGEPARIFFGSDLPPVEGKTMAEKRVNFIKNHQHIADLLLQEPRGYPCMNLDVVFPSTRDGIDWGYIIIEQGAVYPMFSGHNTICVVTALLETGRVKMAEPVTEFSLEAPGGEVQVQAECSNGRVTKVSMTAFPCYVAVENAQVMTSLAEAGPISIDIAYSGMFYVLVNTERLSEVQPNLPPLTPENGRFYAKLGASILQSSMDQHPVEHPTDGYVGPDILMFYNPAQKRTDDTFTVRETVIMQLWMKKSGGGENAFLKNSMLDRSPCGSGSIALAAKLWHDGTLKVGSQLQTTSIVGSQFVTDLVKPGPKVGPFENTLISTVSGKANIYGFNKIIVQPDDPFPSGFAVSDIWT